MATTSNDKSAKRERTISGETQKIFLVIFAILALIGTFTVTASMRGANTFHGIKSVQIPLFQSAGNLKQKALDLIGVYYLLAGENDINFQMEQMYRYDELEKAFNENLAAIKTSGAEITDKNASAEVLKICDETKKTFDQMNNNAREMMINNMNKNREVGKKFFALVIKDVEQFKKSVDQVEALVNQDLNRGTDSALSLLRNSTYAGIFLTIMAVFVTLSLIRYLMKFLSVSLLPISNLMHNLRQSVFSIDKSGQIVSPVSKYSEKVFDKDIVGSDVFELAFDHLGKKSEAYAGVKTAITSVFGEDDMQWSLMEDNFPGLVARRIGDKPEKILKMTYTPLFGKEQTVQNVMIVAEDVTELERVKREALSKQAEVLIIQGLVGVDRGDLEAFLSDAIAGVYQCYDLLSNLETDMESRKLLFRILHTIKGNSRLYNLTTVSEVVHVAENSVVEINNRLDAKDPVGTEFYSRLTSGLREIEFVLASHGRTAEQLFGIKNASSEKIIEALTTKMICFEHAISKESYRVFDQVSVEGQSLKTQYVLSNLSSNIKSTAEELMELAKYMELLELQDAIKDAMGKISEDKTPVEADFVAVRDAFARAAMTTFKSKAYQLGGDELFPVVKTLVALTKQVDALDIASADDAARTAIHDGIFEVYKAAEANGFLGLKFIVQRIAIACIDRSAASLNDALGDAWKYIAAAAHLDSSFRMQPEMVSGFVAFLERHASSSDTELGGSEDFSSLMAFELVFAHRSTGATPAEMAACLTKRTGLTEVKHLARFLAGGSNTQVAAEFAFAEFNEGLQTKDSRDNYTTTMSRLEPAFLRDLMTEALTRGGARVDLFRVLASHLHDASGSSEESQQQNLEVSTQWYQQLEETIGKLGAIKSPEVSTILEQLQEQVASVYDYPIKALCQKMEPMMRDLTKRLGKNINYVVAGDPVAMPREQAYALRDALVHMLRNSLDHGIEMPSDRANRKKPEVATIEISCAFTNTGYEVTVNDDGQGIDTGKVLKKAIAMNAVTEEKSKTMTQLEMQQLVFLSRLSTKEEVSSLSGRGVGMDAVKAIVVERMGGNIEIKSDFGVGTKFTLVIPRQKRKATSSHGMSEVAIFLTESAQSIKESMALASDIATNAESGRKVFQILHTIKGNATMHNLKGFADIIHGTEGLVAQINSGVDAGNFNDMALVEKLRTGLKKIQDSIAAQGRKGTGGGSESAQNRGK
jgi:chemotaxis protein histidine kinase CheA